MCTRGDKVPLGLPHPHEAYVDHTGIDLNNKIKKAAKIKKIINEKISISLQYLGSAPDIDQVISYYFFLNKR